MAVYNDPGPDPVETEINQFFDQIILSVNQRRVAVLTACRELRKEVASKPETRAKMIEELTSMKTETETRLQVNDLHELQEKLLAKIEAELEKTRAPIAATKIVFRGELQALDLLIAKVGEVLEESLSNTSEVPQTEPTNGEPAPAKPPKGEPAPAEPTREGDGPPSNVSNLNS